MYQLNCNAFRPRIGCQGQTCITIRLETMVGEFGLERGWEQLGSETCLKFSSPVSGKDRGEWQRMGLSFLFMQFYAARPISCWPGRLWKPAGGSVMVVMMVNSLRSYVSYTAFMSQQDRNLLHCCAKTVDLTIISAGPIVCVFHSLRTQYCSKWLIFTANYLRT